MWRKTTLAFACLLSVLQSASAQPVTPSEKRFVPFNGVMPLCEDVNVLAKIQKRFGKAERKYWGSGLEMVAFDKIRETGYRLNGIDTIPRRSCTAKVWLNTGEERMLVYSIGEDTGFAGGDFLGLPFGGVNLFKHWGVTFCVAGLDRSLTYGRNCQSARS
jgi:hypothetical protein